VNLGIDGKRMEYNVNLVLCLRNAELKCKDFIDAAAARVLRADATEPEIGFSAN
jgi:hypothetical protein